MKKKWSIYILTVAVLSLSIVQAYAENVDDLKKQKQNINKQIEQKKDDIKSLENQTKDITKEIEELDKKLDIATNELEQVEKEIEELEIDIEKTTLELKEAEENIEEKDDTFKKRLRVMYKMGNAEFLEILLSSADIKDLLSRVDMIKAITKHDTELIQYMKEQRDLIDSKKSDLEMQKSAYEVSKIKLEDRRRAITIATREKQDRMSSLEKNIEAYERQIDKLNEEAEQLEAEIIKRQVNTGTYSEGAMAWPVPGHSRISSPYGYRIHPILKTKKYHTGIDIPAPTGTPIIAAKEGIVIYSGTLGGYGKTIMIDHGDSIVSLYAHNSTLVVKEGQKVDKGDVVAKAGSTGMSTGPHCHFEVRKNGAHVDPMPYLK